VIGRAKDPERPPRVAFGIYKRALLGGVVIIIAVAVTVTSVLVLKIDTIVQILKSGEKGHEIRFQRATLSATKTGGPQTILVLGSDHRFQETKAKKGGHAPQSANSDTIMLIHMDPNAAATTVMSIPRDLQVTIPGVGVQKINSAFATGGPDLTARTVKNLLGPSLKINHVVTMQFHSFQTAVNFLHGVYVNVDQFYYHSNAGLPPSQDYSEIDVKPGYQKLYGSDALAYVRYRHTDSDFIRADRQQDFLLEVKDQIGQSRLLNQITPLIKIFSHYTQFDQGVTTDDGIFRLLYLAAYSAKHPIEQVKFGPTGDQSTATSDYVTVDPAVLPALVHKFLHPPKKSTTTKIKVKGSTPKHTKKPVKHHHQHKTKQLAQGLIAAKSLMENAVAPVIARQQVSFPVYVPAAIVAGTSLKQYTSPAIENPYPYKIYDRDTDKRHPKGHAHSAYVIVMADNLLQGGYYDVQGTDWMNPPLLAHPTQIVEKGGRKLLYFTSGHKLRYVAWRTKHAVYWVSNTLDYELSNQQMVGIAMSLTYD
jgi:LCP family protein required for cell wall assembly